VAAGNNAWRAARTAASKLPGWELFLETEQE